MIKLSYRNEFLSDFNVRHGVGTAKGCTFTLYAPPSMRTHQAHIRHIEFFSEFQFLFIFWQKIWCAWCVQILPTFSYHSKLFRVDLNLSNEHHRSFVTQKLAPVAQMEIWWKFWKIDFRMKKHFCRKIMISGQIRDWATGASFYRRKACDTALESFWSILLSCEHFQVCAHIRHIL